MPYWQRLDVKEEISLPARLHELFRAFDSVKVVRRVLALNTVDEIRDPCPGDRRSDRRSDRRRR